MGYAAYIYFPVKTVPPENTSRRCPLCGCLGKRNGNWHSHVTEEKMEAIYQKWKPFFNVFSISLYYLNEADYDEYMEDDDDDDAGSILAKFIDEIVNDINMNKLYRPDSGYLVKP